MLIKLTKQELKATARIFLPLLGLLAIVTFLTKVLSFENPLTQLLGSYASVISLVINVLLFFIVLVVCFVLTIQRFYKNLYGDEGYLMHTLPVGPWQLIMSKSIISVLWFIISGGVMFALILYIGSATLALGGMKDVWMDFWGSVKLFSATFRLNPTWMIIQAALLILLNLISLSMTVYASLSIGQLVNRRRMLLSAAAFIAFMLLFGQLNDFIKGLIENANPAIYGDLADNSTAGQALQGYAGMYTLFALAQSIICFFITHILMRRRLNLQ